MVKLITKDSDYAIRALMVMAERPADFMAIRDISKSQGIPYQFLRGIVQRLIRHGLVISRKGVLGGVRIKRDPKKVSIVDVIRIFQGELELADCIFRKKMCSGRANCVLRKEINRVKKMVKKEFKGVTIAKLLKREG